MVQTCTPPNRCEGIGNSTKEEEGHCPGEGKDTCQELKCGKTSVVQLDWGTYCPLDIYLEWKITIISVKCNLQGCTVQENMYQEITYVAATFSPYISRIFTNL